MSHSARSHSSRSDVPGSKLATSQVAGTRRSAAGGKRMARPVGKWFLQPDAIRDDLKQRGIRAVIPPKSNRTKTIRYNKRLYRRRNCIEPVLGHLKTAADDHCTFRATGCG